MQTAASIARVVVLLFLAFVTTAAFIRHRIIMNIVSSAAIAMVDWVIVASLTHWHDE